MYCFETQIIWTLILIGTLDNKNSSCLHVKISIDFSWIWAYVYKLMYFFGMDSHSFFRYLCEKKVRCSHNPFVMVMVAGMWLVDHLKKIIILQIRLASCNIKTTFLDIEEVLTAVYKICHLSWSLHGELVKILQKSRWSSSFQKTDIMSKMLLSSPIRLHQHHLGILW